MIKFETILHTGEVRCSYSWGYITDVPISEIDEYIRVFTEFLIDEHANNLSYISSREGKNRFWQFKDCWLSKNKEDIREYIDILIKVKLGLS